MAQPKIRDYPKLAADILNAVGGAQNISNATRCATRLRLVLKSTPETAKAAVSAMPGVITVVESGGQFQVVIGPHVAEVYQAVADTLHLEDNPTAHDAPKTSVFNRVIATMSAVFAPFVYILAGAGLLQGALILITLAFPAFAQTGTYEVLSLMSWAPFTFLPIFIAITASRHFKCSVYIAVLCCTVLVSPSLTELAGRVAAGETVKFLVFSLPETTYTSTVLPPLFLVWLLSYVEHFFDKHLPDTFKNLLTPLLCLLIMVPATLLVVGPITAAGANLVANGYNFLYETAPVVAAGVVGALFQILVIFGVHWGVLAMVLANYEMYGRDSFQLFQALTIVAQVGAVFGIWWRSKNKEIQNLALSAGFTGLFGITEPALYGVTLRFKKPFVCGCIASCAGSVLASLFHGMYYAYAGLPGPITMVNAINPEEPLSFIGALVGTAVALVAAFVLVQLVGFDDPKPE